jgi:hypothetical protein
MFVASTVSCGDRLVDGGVDDDLDHLAVADGGELAVRRVALTPLGRRVALDDEQDAVSGVACIEQLGGDAVLARLVEEGDCLIAVVAALLVIPCAVPPHVRVQHVARRLDVATGKGGPAPPQQLYVARAHGRSVGSGRHQNQARLIAYIRTS